MHYYSCTDFVVNKHSKGEVHEVSKSKGTAALLHQAREITTYLGFCEEGPILSHLQPPTFHDLTPSK